MIQSAEMLVFGADILSSKMPFSYIISMSHADRAVGQDAADAEAARAPYRSNLYRQLAHAGKHVRH